MNERLNILLVIAAVSILTLVYYKVKVTSHVVTEYQYTIARIGLSKCEYIAARKSTNDAWIIVTHKGDCSFCATNKPVINLLSK